MSEPAIRKLNVNEAFAGIDECWSPRIAARVNGQEVRLAKIEGAFEWHRHDGLDEAFFVVKGRFEMRFRDGGREWSVAMEDGDLLVVPANVEHLPVADEECWIMLIDAEGELNTGTRVTARTKRDLPEAAQGRA